MTSEASQMSQSMPHPNGSNGYMGGYHPGMPPMMPSTSNGIMANFSMDEANMRNSGSPMMMQNSPMVSGTGPPPFMHGPPQSFHSMMPPYGQNPSQYNPPPNGPPPPFPNAGMPPQFYSNQMQPMPPSSSPGRNSNYPPSNASNANNTPTYPNPSATPNYQNASQMQQNGSYQNNGAQGYPPMPPEFSQGPDERNPPMGSDGGNQPNYQSNEESTQNGYYMNRESGNFNGSGPGPAPFQRQMSSLSNAGPIPPPMKQNSGKTMVFNSDMLNKMVKDKSDNPENWHANYVQQQLQPNNGNAKATNRKRKMDSPSVYSNNIPNDFTVSMGDYHSPMSNNSLPDLNNPSMLNGSQMASDNYSHKREKRDDNDPLLCIERMTHERLDNSPKPAPRESNKKQEDRNQKLAKLKVIENDLNLSQAVNDYPSPMTRPPMPMGPGQPPPHMMMQMRPPFPFPPGYDGNPRMMMAPGSMPPQMFNGMPHPGMPPQLTSPNFVNSSSPAHSQNGMMPNYPNMPQMSPKFNMMPPPMCSPQGNMGPPYHVPMDGMRPPMHPDFWPQRRMMPPMPPNSGPQPIPGQIPM